MGKKRAANRTNQRRPAREDAVGGPNCQTGKCMCAKCWFRRNQEQVLTLLLIFLKTLLTVVVVMHRV